MEKIIISDRQQKVLIVFGITVTAGGLFSLLYFTKDVIVTQLMLGIYFSLIWIIPVVWGAVIRKYGKVLITIPMAFITLIPVTGSRVNLILICFLLAAATAAIYFIWREEIRSF